MLTWVTGEEAEKLPEIFEFRYRVFVCELGWDLPVAGESESDQFDTERALYLLWKDPDIRAMYRLIPTTEPYMIQTLWPDLMGAEELYRTSSVWEVSRLGVDSRLPHRDRSKILKAMVYEGMELAKRRGIQFYIAAMSPNLARLVFPDGNTPLHQYTAGRRVGDHHIAAIRIHCTETAVNAAARRVTAPAI